MKQFLLILLLFSFCSFTPIDSIKIKSKPQIVKIDTAKSKNEKSGLDFFIVGTISFLFLLYFLVVPKK